MTFLQSIRDNIVRAVAELPDRTSSGEDPDMMMVSQAELEAILDRCFDVPPPDLCEAGEANYQAYCAACRSDEQIEPELTLRMIETWSPEVLPANERGQVHFARIMLDSAASTIRFLLQADRPSEGPSAGQPPAGGEQAARTDK